MSLFLGSVSNYGGGYAPQNRFSNYEGMAADFVRNVFTDTSDTISDTKIQKYIESSGIGGREFNTAAAVILHKLQNRLLPESSLGMLHWKEQLDLPTNGNLLLSFMCACKCLMKIETVATRRPLGVVFFKLLEKNLSYDFWCRIASHQSSLNQHYLSYSLGMLDKELESPVDYNRRLSLEDIFPLILAMDVLLQKDAYNGRELTDLFYQLKRILELTPPHEKESINKALLSIPHWAVKNLLELLLPLLEARYEQRMKEDEPIVVRTRSPDSMTPSSPSLLTDMLTGVSREQMKRSLWFPNNPGLLKLVFLVLDKGLEMGGAKPAVSSLQEADTAKETIKWIIHFWDRHTKPEERDALVSHIEKLDSFRRAGELSRIYLKVLASKTEVTAGQYLPQYKGIALRISGGGERAAGTRLTRSGSGDAPRMEQINGKLASISDHVLVAIAKALSGFALVANEDPDQKSLLELLADDERISLITEIMDAPEDHSRIIQEYLPD